MTLKGYSDNDAVRSRGQDLVRIHIYYFKVLRSSIFILLLYLFLLSLSFLLLSFHSLLCLLHYNVESPCRGFMTTELVFLWEEESARTLGVLDVDG